MRDPEFQDNHELSLRIDEGGKPHSNIWKRLSRVMEVVIYALLVLAVIKLFGPEMDRQEELKVEKAAYFEYPRRKSAEGRPAPAGASTPEDRQVLSRNRRPRSAQPSARWRAHHSH